MLRKEGSLTRTRDSQALQWLGQVLTSAPLHCVKDRRQKEERIDLNILVFCEY